MSEAFDPLLTSALVRLAEDDPHTAAVAGAAFRVLTGDRRADSVTRHTVEVFLWRTLPSRWTDAPASPEDVAAALGRLFDLSGSERYAQVCRCRTTRRILAGYRRNPQHGRRSATLALIRSPYTPPDLPELTWSTNMGAEEMAVYLDAAAALEIAFSTRRGSTHVGTVRTRDAVARSHLTRSGPDGRTPIERVEAERIRRWAAGGHPARRMLTEALVPRLIPEIGHPAEPTAGVAPLHTLLEHATVGLPLGPDRRPDASFIADLCRHFGWPSEDSFHTVHSLLAHMGALRCHRRREVITARGVVLFTRPALLWRLVASRLWPHGAPGQARATEFLLASLAADANLPDPSSVPPVDATPEDIHLAHHRLTLLGRTLGLLSAHDTSATPVGVAAALYALRLLASSPVTQP